MSDADSDGALPYQPGWEFDTHPTKPNPTSGVAYDETKATGDTQ